METNLLSYYVIINLENLCYIDSNGNFATINEAKKFYNIEEAEEFLTKLIYLKNISAIYKVNTHITLNLEEYGKDIDAIPTLVCKHNIGKDLSSEHFIITTSKDNKDFFEKGDIQND